MAEVHAQAARTNGGGAETGDGPDPHAWGRDQPRREAGPKGRQPGVAKRGAESAWPNGNSAATPSGDRATSERPQDHGAPTEVAEVVQGITTLAVLAVAVVAAVASYDHQRALAELAGEGWRAWLLPVSGRACRLR